MKKTLTIISIFIACLLIPYLGKAKTENIPCDQIGGALTCLEGQSVSYSNVLYACDNRNDFISMKLGLTGDGKLCDYWGEIQFERSIQKSLYQEMRLHTKYCDISTNEGKCIEEFERISYDYWMSKYNENMYQKTILKYIDKYNSL